MINFFKSKLKKLEMSSRSKKKIDLPQSSLTRIYSSLVYFRYIKDCNFMNLIIEMNFENSYNDTMIEFEKFKELCNLLGVVIIEQTKETNTNILVVFKSYDALSEIILQYTHVYPWNNGNQFISSLMQLVSGIPKVNSITCSPYIDAYGDVPYVKIFDSTDITNHIMIDNPEDFNFMKFDINLVNITVLLTALCNAIVIEDEQEIYKQYTLMALISNIDQMPITYSQIIQEMEKDSCNYKIRDKHLIKDIRYFINPNLME